MSRISEVYLSTLSSLISPYGLDRYYFPLLYLYKNNGNITQKDLAEVIRRDKVYTMRIVDYLCSKKLLIRTQDCNDRRCQLLEVTTKGKKLVPHIKKAIDETNEMLLHNFSKSEKEQFKSSMDKLFATISTLPEPEYIVKAFKRNKK